MHHALLFVVATLLAGVAGATDLPRIFMTSTRGPGDMSAWADAHGLTGIAAADEVCRTRAAAAGLARAANYVAFLSDGMSDAYCRVHGLTGRLSDECGLPTRPIGAGPWYGMDDLPVLDVSESSLSAYAGYVPRPVAHDEFGASLALTTPRTDLAFTGSGTAGAARSPEDTCSDWTEAGSSSAPGTSASVGFGGWSAYHVSCDREARLVCLEAGRHGPQLPRRRPPTARVAFTTAASGTGDLSSWPLAGGSVGIAAGDEICRASAAAAGLPLASTFKAWLSTASIDAASRFVHDGPWFRVDGVRVTASLTALAAGRIEAPLQINESLLPMMYIGAWVWTGTLANGKKGTYRCDDWTNGTNGDGDEAFGHAGMSYFSDAPWTLWDFIGSANSCAINARLYCFADNDSLFLDGFE
jgi:hypothetical protein